MHIDVDNHQIIAEGTALAYKGASGDIQQKIRRVIEVWRGRQIFDQPVQEAVEGKVDGTACDPQEHALQVDADS